MGKTAIANYESYGNGKLPNQEKLIAIAQHYNVTIDGLLYRELQLERIPYVEIHSKEASKICIEGLFPLIGYPDDYPEEDKKLEFLEALEIHKKIFQYVYDEKLDEHLDECWELIDQYEDLIQEGIYVAAPNQLCIFGVFAIAIFYLNNELFMNPEEISKYKTVSELAKNGFLKNTSKHHEVFLKEVNEAKEWFFENFGDKTIRNISILKQLGESELADYYTVLFYTVGAMKNNLSRGENRFIGHELMRVFSLMGNPYIESFHNTYEKCKEIFS